MTIFARFALVLTLFLSLVEAKTLSQIDSEITATKSRIENSKTKESSLQSRVESLSSEITKANKALKEIEQDISSNSTTLENLTKDTKNQKEEHDKLQSRLDTLMIEKENLEKELANLLANHLAQTLVLSKKEPSSEDDLIKKSIYEKIKTKTAEDTLKITKEYDLKKRDIGKIEKRLAELNKKQKELHATQDRQNNLLAKQAKVVKELDSQKSRYLADLNRLIEQKNRERQMLADLHITRQQRVDTLKQAQISKQEATRRSSLSEADQKKIQAMEVKQYGSSYQQASSSGYSGRKVKAPFDDKLTFALTREFGPYTDPIYNLKIHNDSVTLRSDQDNAIVRSVLDGKVIFADDIKLLGKVVIVEHGGNIHTIYRNLETISPNIRVNSRLKSRETIGRVASELVFEVTKNGLPINPLQLIALK